MLRALAVLVLAGLCAAQEPLELPRVGTIGDLPAESSIVVEITKDGALRLGGKELTLVEFRARLAAIGADRAMATKVVLRADSRLPWPAAFEVMSACVKVRLFRVFWAVRPEEGDEEGGFATWCERPAFGLAGPGRQSMISVRGHVAASDLSALRAALRKPPRKVQGVLVCGLPAASVSDVLRTCDAVCRAGIDGLSFVTFGDAPAPELETVAKLESAADGGPPALLLDSNPVPATEALVPARPVRKGFAGWATVGSVRKKPTACEQGVELGLAWLAAHQSREDGRWDCDGFMGNDPADDKCDGAGRPAHDVAVTALALLTFLGAGYTDGILPGEDTYSRAVTRGLDYLVRVQDKDGCFGPRTDLQFLYGHAIATLAMCEAQWRTGNPVYRLPAQKGLDFLASVRNPQLAWGYPAGKNDTSLTAWCVCAIRSGQYAGLRVEDPDAFDGARAWLEKLTDKETGRVSADEAYQPWRPSWLSNRFPLEKSEAMTAAGIFCRVLLGEDPRTSAVIRKSSALCAARPPTWNPDDGSFGMYDWYWGTLALFQVGGNDWSAWEKAMKEAIVRHQHQPGEGSRTGSWDPIDGWGPEGGRVYSTALMTMCLEVYHRYDRVFGPK